MHLRKYIIGHKKCGKTKLFSGLSKNKVELHRKIWTHELSISKNLVKLVSWSNAAILPSYPRAHNDWEVNHNLRNEMRRKWPISSAPPPPMWNNQHEDKHIKQYKQMYDTADV